MELALNKPSSCVDCCKDCTLLPCCSASACCDASCDAACGLIPPDPVRYEYQEPEENFISIDDVKIKSFLWQIGQQQREKELEIKRIMEQEKREKREKERREAEKRRDQEVIELDEEEAQSPRGLIISAARSLAHWNSSIRRVTPDIELIPRRVHRVVAEIELSDSDHDEDSEVDEDVSLPSNAVSCVLNEQRQDGSQNPQELVIIVPSDQEDEQKTDNVIKRKSSGSRRLVKRRPGANRRGRHMYECPDCGKKVQSNYNLRRHMMIHTGERPFPCDLCERRFREFSDLKKHRRRHSHDPQFICMICHLGAPLEQDSTRCADCESKNLMVKPQPEELGEKTTEEHSDEMEGDDDEIEEAALENEKQPQVATQPSLMVTLIPPIQSPPEKVPSHTQPSRPPLPRSCSSANSSSSMSNDGNIAGKSMSRTRRSYPCPLCHRPFGTRHNLKRHYMIHTGEKPFSCSKCRKPFRECSTLKKHMVTHVRDRWYKCLRCPSKFRDYLEYSDHKNNHQDQLSSRKSSIYESDDDGDSSVEDCLECCECQQRFTELDAYTAHLKKHDLELYGMSIDDVADEEQDDVDVA